MAQYVIATTKSWNIENSKKLMETFPKEQFYLITEKEELTVERLKELNPRYVFFSTLVMDSPCRGIRKL